MLRTVSLYCFLACIAAGAVSARAKPGWEEIGKACAARYGLHDNSGRNSKAELDCIDYYSARGHMPPDPAAAAHYGDDHNDWVQSLCAGVAGRTSLNQAFTTYDSCRAWAKFVGLSQREARHLSAIYGIDRP